MVTITLTTAQWERVHTLGVGREQVFFVDPNAEGELALLDTNDTNETGKEVLKFTRKSDSTNPSGRGRLVLTFAGREGGHEVRKD